MGAGHARKRLRLPPWASLSRAAMLGSVLALSGCDEHTSTFLSPAGPIAALQRDHLWEVTLISLIVVLPVLLLVPVIVWRYRYGNTKATYTPHWDFSHALEWAMWLIPAAIVVALSVLLWIDTHKLDPYRPISSATPPLRVQVVGLDWKWLFIYPDYHIATVGRMAFPKDRPVAMELTTDTVMQSFMISALGGQIYAMPGMITKLHLKSDKLGSFEGMNTQYSGEGFDKQHFTAVAMTTKNFDSWVNQVQTQGVALNGRAYSVLGKSSTPEQVHATFASKAIPAGVTYFNNVAPNFFKSIVQRYHAGKMVARDQQPGAIGYGAAHAVSE